MHEFYLFMLIGVSVLISISSIEDLFIDILAVGIARFKIDTIPEKSQIPEMAVFVANWREEDVLGKMVEGNLARIPIEEVKLYLGVYPNDAGTLRVAKELEAKYPSRVRVIVNTLCGPTSKGQMLNEMFAKVFGDGRADCPVLATLHDSEDVIDPRSFEIYAAYAAQGYDFIQIPVFSLNRGSGAHVASTYMDEFAERHTGEMIVRNALGAMIPSAGVGTGMTSRLLKHFLAERGQVLMSGTVTEDYILGVEAKRAGFKSAFAAVSADEKDGLDFVATREFFPKSFSAAVKQKTRWVYGINFEAMHKLGWKGDMWDKYFFFRDRKGMITNFLPPISLFFIIGVLGGKINIAEFPEDSMALLRASMMFNLAALVIRYMVRVRSCYKVYGKHDWAGVLIRWPVGICINMMAVFRAWKTYVGESEFATKPIVWSKTTHELPEDFISAKR